MLTRKWVALFTLFILITSACGDDTLDEAFQRKEIEDPNSTYPVEIGETFAAFFALSLKPTAAAGAGGFLQDEQQASGMLCAKVDGVQPEVEVGQPATLSARVKINGNEVDNVIQPNIYLVDESGPADATVIYDNHAGLFLRDMLVPYRNHGFESVSSQSFNTQAPVTRGGSLSGLLFFDPRTSPDQSWGGWNFYDEASDTKNYTGTALQNVQTMLGIVDPFNRAAMDFDFPVAENCGSFGEAPTCNQAAGCLWSFSLDACEYQWAYAAEIRFRETRASGPTELQGDVLHRIRMEYGPRGVLWRASELITIDATSPGSNVPGAITQCGDACLQADVMLRRNLDWSQAACTH